MFRNVLQGPGAISEEISEKISKDWQGLPVAQAAESVERGSDSGEFSTR